MKIGILLAGHTPDKLLEKHGDYDSMFQRLLDGHGFEFVTYPLLDGVMPANVHAADGWLITGSKFSAYDEHSWIPPLEDFLRAAYDSAVPIVGICFGHQILAQALGGKVEKFSGGWSVGLQTYKFEGFPKSLQLLAWHQDQVVELPDDAAIAGSSAFCHYAALAYSDKAYSIQPHPEFVSEFVADLVAVSGAVLPHNIAQEALDSLRAKTSSKEFANWIANFFKMQR